MADITRINGETLSSYGASLLSYNTGAISLSKNYFKADNRLRPTVFRPKMPLRNIVLKLEFIGSTDYDAENKASSITQVFSEETELFLQDGYYYRCVLLKTGTPNRIANGIFQREFTLIGYRHGEKKTVAVFTTGTSIQIEGNYKAEVKFTCTASATTVTVNGITIENASVASTIVIDGIDGFVLQNGQNKFQDADITEFPTVQPGEQEIVFSGTSSVTVEYYPIYF